MGSEEEEKAQNEAYPMWLRLVHYPFLMLFLYAHIELLGIHIRTAKNFWSFVMVSSEMCVMVLHVLGLRRGALLMSIGEMAGGHYQHIVHWPTPLEGLMSTFPYMTCYIGFAVMAYLTAPYAKKDDRPTLKNLLLALVLGVIITAVLEVIVNAKALPNAVPSRVIVMGAATLQLFVPALRRVPNAVLNVFKPDGC